MTDLNKFTLDIEAEKNAFDSILQNTLTTNSQNNMQVVFDPVQYNNERISYLKENINVEALSTAFNSSIIEFNNLKLNDLNTNTFNNLSNLNSQTDVNFNNSIVNPSDYEKTNFNNVVQMADMSYRTLNAPSSQKEIYQTLNAMSMGVMHLNNKINQKSEIRSNPSSLSEPRETIAPKNLMFYDRLARASKKPKWA